MQGILEEQKQKSEKVSLPATSCRQSITSPMRKLRLTLACWDYDRTRALMDGRVQPDGIDLTYLSQPVEETFFRMMRFKEFHCSEMSLSSYAAVPRPGDPPFHRDPGLPVALLPPFVHLRLGEKRHPPARGPQRQAPRRSRVPDDRGGMDARHPVRRLTASRSPTSSTSPAPGRAGRGRQAQGGFASSIKLRAIGPKQTLSKMIADGEIDAFRYCADSFDVYLAAGEK